MNIIRVTAVVTAYVPGVVTRTFAVDEEIPPYSPYYWPVLWSGNAVDTGVSDSIVDSPIFTYSRLVISDEDPGLGEQGIWVQTFPASENYTMWIEDGS